MRRIRRENIADLLQWEQVCLEEICRLANEMRVLFEMLGLSCAVTLERRQSDGGLFEAWSREGVPDGFHEVIQIAPTQDGFLLEREEGEIPVVAYEIARARRRLWCRNTLFLYDGRLDEIRDELHKELEPILTDPSAYRVNWQETETFLQKAARVCFPLEETIEPLI